MRSSGDTTYSRPKLVEISFTVVVKARIRKVKAKREIKINAGTQEEEETWENQ